MCRSSSHGSLLRRIWLPLLLLSLSGTGLCRAETDRGVVATLGSREIFLADLQPEEALLALFAASHTEQETAAWRLGVMAKTLSETILLSLGEAFMQDRNLSPSPTDIGNVQQMFSQLRPGQTLRSKEAADWWRTWKLNQALHAEFGGRCVPRLFGLEAIEAFGRYLEDAEAKGRFSIRSKEMRRAFYHYFRTVDQHAWYDGDTADWFTSAERAMFLAHRLQAKGWPSTTDQP